LKFKWLVDAIRTQLVLRKWKRQSSAVIVPHAQFKSVNFVVVVTGEDDNKVGLDEQMKKVFVVQNTNLESLVENTKPCVQSGKIEECVLST
jgi:hypothetical protein